MAPGLLPAATGRTTTTATQRQSSVLDSGSNNNNNNKTNNKTNKRRRLPGSCWRFLPGHDQGSADGCSPHCRQPQQTQLHDAEYSSEAHWGDPIPTKSTRRRWMLHDPNRLYLHQLRQECCCCTKRRGCRRRTCFVLLVIIFAVCFELEICICLPWLFGSRRYDAKTNNKDPTGLRPNRWCWWWHPRRQEQQQPASPPLYPTPHLGMQAEIKASASSSSSSSSSLLPTVLSQHQDVMTATSAPRLLMHQQQHRQQSRTHPGAPIRLELQDFAIRTILPTMAGHEQPVVLSVEASLVPEITRWMNQAFRQQLQDRGWIDHASYFPFNSVELIVQRADYWSAALEEKPGEGESSKLLTVVFQASATFAFETKNRKDDTTAIHSQISADAIDVISIQRYILTNKLSSLQRRLLLSENMQVDGLSLIPPTRILQQLNATRTPSTTASPGTARGPTLLPTIAPTTQKHGPSRNTREPSIMPTKSSSPSVPTSLNPSVVPSISLLPTSTSHPSAAPTISPKPSVSIYPTETPGPTLEPSSYPSKLPTAHPTRSAMPTLYISALPSDMPTGVPSIKPSLTPSAVPSTSPTTSDIPSTMPTESMRPTTLPSAFPSSLPTSSSIPSVYPSGPPSSTPAPTYFPSIPPTARPTTIPSRPPSAIPSIAPSVTLVNISRTGVNMILWGLDHEMGPAEQGEFQNITSEHVHSFWRDLPLSDVYVGFVSTRFWKQNRTIREPRNTNGTVNNGTVTVPIRLIYNQTILYGIEMEPLDSIFYNIEEQLFTLPFEQDALPFVTALGQITNNTRPILFVNASVTVPAPPPPAPVPVASTNDRRIIGIVVGVVVFAVVALGGYIVYLIRRGHPSAQSSIRPGLDNSESYDEDDDSYGYDNNNRPMAAVPLVSPLELSQLSSRTSEDKGEGGAELSTVIEGGPLSKRSGGDGSSSENNMSAMNDALAQDQDLNFESMNDAMANFPTVTSIPVAAIDTAHGSPGSNSMLLEPGPLMAGADGGASRMSTSSGLIDVSEATDEDDRDRSDDSGLVPTLGGFLMKIEDLDDM